MRNADAAGGDVDADRRRVVVVAPEDERRASVVDGLAGEWAVETASPTACPTGEFACVVVTMAPTGASAACEAVASVHAPTVVFADADPAAVRPLDEFDGFVRDDGSEAATARLRDEVAWQVAGEDDYPTALRDRHAKVTRLHRVATELVACDTESAVYEAAVRAAEGILDLDLVGIALVEDGWFVPVAASDAMAASGHVVAGEMPADEGIAGESYRSGESVVVDEVTDREDVQVDVAAADYRSVLSVPIGDFAVLQAGSPAPAAFDAHDLELAELLGTHVAETVERLRTEERLRAEHDRLSALFENVPDPVIRFELVGEALQVREVNPPFESTFGWSSEAVVGEDIDEYIVPDGYEDEAATLNEKLVAGESLQMVSRRKTHEAVRDFLLHVVPFERGERGVQGYAIYTDITEEKERQRELERQNERLDAFARIVSHDLRNPLSIARGYLDLAEESGDPAQFAEIRRAHDRMNALVDDLLALARQGDVVGETEPVDLDAAATQAWASVMTGDATLSVAVDGTVDADRDRLVELFENLFRNAVTHGTGGDEDPDGMAGPAGRCADGSPLSVAVRGLGDRSGFAVTDDGVGFRGDGDSDSILESGFTTSETGTGFGLTIVQEIAEAHGWSVVVEDDDGLAFSFVVDE